MYNDNHTLNNGYDSIFTNAWEIVDWAEETPNKAASTSSAFNEAGPADRWLVTPPITIPMSATNTTLTFKARSFDIFPRQDGFKLKISTTTNSKSSFTTILLVVPNTPNTLLENVTNTSVNLTSYAGQTIYLAWIDDFENGNILAIDDIDVSANALSVSEHSTNYPALYPNPTKDVFTINLNEEILSLLIYSIDGKLVKTVYNSKSIDISDLANSNYLLKVLSGNNVYTKFIVKK